ncbi:MAG: hypothetical protein KKE65_10445 [Actinobacteria bacterium]|nr:hypothetical protein [Actinomycetota bacterium]MBU2112067.1 hypothetical protein [Actinomycetota bacterium]
MSTLHERLGDLAGSAPLPPPDPDLWDRARRYHRRRRVGTAAVAATCVLAVLALVGLDTWQRSPSIEPAAPGTDPALPARLWEPSAWLPGTDGEPTGPLAALMEAERKSLLSSGPGVVGVSATTGEYRFLDLPEDAHESMVGHALSPDGAKVAYWLTGEPSGDPQTHGGQSLPVVGVAVWDARTGAVVRHEVETEHGLAAYELLWADGDRVVLSWGQERVGDQAPTRKQGGSMPDDGLRVWEPGTGEPTAIGLTWTIDADSTNGRGQVLLSTNSRSVLDLSTGRRTGPDRLGAKYGGVSALSPDGRTVAYPKGASNPNRLFLSEQGQEPRLLLDEKVWAAVGWRDEDTVAFVTRDTDLDPIPATIETISLSTGDRTELIDAGTFQPWPGNLATDLLAVEPRDFAEPPSPWNPRIVAGLVGFAVLVALIWLWGWRRSARP